MRNLMITRHKSFVGCAMKDKVYIRDEQSQELIIDGVPCRKIGEIKNGETKTFSIEEGEQQIFLIADRISKEYCNATVTIPEGQEDVALSGKHHFVFGSNPFRFDGVAQSEGQLRKQRRNGRIGVVIACVAMAVGIALGFFLMRGLFDAASRTEAEKTKTFTKGEFQITLTDAFKQVEQQGFFASYQSKNVMVLAVRESETLFIGDITLKEYGNLVLKSNGKTDLTMNKDEKFLWFEYIDTPEDQTFYYLAVCCRSRDAFWVINFVTPVSHKEQYKETFLSWARSIVMDQT
ncbi:MAG: hypothetical protein E7453_08970 [Ruminococcaceae bacterium]|nr:hypothetical protein [Oscillospiraceae bacterium]